MRKWLIAGALLMAVAALAAPGGRDTYFQIGRSIYANPVLRLLPGGGGSAKVAQDPCSLFASSLTGNYFCLRGDATQSSSAAATLSAQGSPTTVSATRCPNGPDCATKSAQSLDGTTQYFASSALNAPTGDFSGCALVRMLASGANQMLLTKMAGAGNQSFQFYINNSNGLTLDIWKTGDTNSSISSAAALTHGVYHFVCFTYDFVADGSSVLQVYIDGAQSGAGSTTAVGPVEVSATQGLEVARRSGGAPLYLLGEIAWAFHTETLLSSGTISEMSKSVLPVVTTTTGAALSLTRASARSCPASTLNLTTQASGTPCETTMGLEVERAVTNVVIWSEHLGDASWVAGGTATKGTSNVAVAPDGSTTMDATSDGATNNSSVSQAVTVSSSTGPFTVSTYVRSVSGTSTHTLVGQCATSNVASCSCVVSDGSTCTAASATTFCYGQAISVSTTTVRVATTFTCAGAETSVSIGLQASAKDANGASAYWWGHQVEPLAFASTYLRTFGTTATRNADQFTVATNASWPTGAGELRAFYTPNWSTNPPDTRAMIVSTRTAGIDGWELAIPANGTLTAFFGDGSAFTQPASASLAWAAGQTYRIRMVWGGGNVWIYRDEQLVKSVTDGSVKIPVAVHTVAGIGHWIGDTSGSFANGILSGVEVYR